MESNRPPFLVVLLISSVLLFLLAINAKVDQTAGDSRYSLLVSQAIWQHGSVKLDPYAYEVDLIGTNGGPVWQFSRWDSTNHFYYFYPVGTPLFSVPAVAVANALGMDMLQLDHDAALQRTLAALIFLLVFLQLFRLARLYLDDWKAWLFAMIFVLGSSFSSTMATALWGQNFQTLFILTALLEMVSVVRGKRETVRPYFFGFLLFAAFICRPTSWEFIVLAFVWLGFRQRPMLLRSAATAAGLLLCFLIWSKVEYGMWLPIYYQSSTWPEGEGGFLFNFAALMAGPARGLFSFTPVLLLIFAGWFSADLRRNMLWYLLWAWLIVHSIAMARASMAWAGWCYGPRFFLEILPGLAVLLLEVHERFEDKWKTRLVQAFVVLSCWGIFVHTYQGLYNPFTKDWNGMPNIDKNWNYAGLNWHYPQFLASEKANQRRFEEFILRSKHWVGAWEIPNGEGILDGPNSREMRLYCKHINDDGGIDGHRVYNSLPAMTLKGISAGWVTPQGQPLLPKDRVVLEPVETGNLAAWLEKNKGYTLLLAIKDEGTTQLSDTSKAWLRAAGARIDSLHFRDSYLAMIDYGRVIHEEMGARRLVWKHSDGFPIKKRHFEVISAGMDAGNEAVLRVNGTNFSHNFRGFNCVAVDTMGKVRDFGHFDTHHKDRQTPNYQRFYVR